MKNWRPRVLIQPRAYDSGSPAGSAEARRARVCARPDQSAGGAQSRRGGARHGARSTRPESTRCGASRTRLGPGRPRGPTCAGNDESRGAHGGATPRRGPRGPGADATSPGTWRTAGTPSSAVREIESARARLRGADLARSEVFRVVVYHLADRTAEALPASERALSALRRQGDTVWEARLSFNRGVVLAEIGDHVAARKELERARDLYSSVGYDVAAAEASIELGLLPSLAGDPLRSLVELDAIDTSSLSDFMICWLHLNRAEALLRLRLLPEARSGPRAFRGSPCAERSPRQQGSAGRSPPRTRRR